MRFVNLTGFPGEFIADERNEIVEVYHRLSGDKEFFSYSKRFGASLLYFSTAVISLFMLFIRENIDFLRLIPALLSAAAAVAAFFLGKELKDKKTGIAMFFICAASGWAFFLSRMSLANAYVPFFVFLSFFLALKYIQTPSLKNFLFFFLSLSAGLFTYSSFVLIIPLFIYALIEHRERLGKRNLLVSSLPLSFLFLFFVFLNFTNAETLNWALSQASRPDNTPGPAVFERIANIFLFFTAPLVTSNAFVKTRPILNFSEFFFLLGGLVILVSSLRDKNTRIILAGFIFSLFTVLFSGGLDHHWRHIMLLPFVIIISGIFAGTMLNKRKFYILLIVSSLLSINTVFYYFTEWGIQNNNPLIHKEISSHINARCNKNCLVIHELFPYGAYETYLRTKSAYDNPESPEKVFILAPYTYRKQLLNVLSGAKITYFYNTKTKSTETIALIEHTIASPEEVSSFLILKKSLSAAAMNMWNLNYEAVLSQLWSETPGEGDIGSIKNLGLYIKGLEASLRSGKQAESLPVLRRFAGNMLKPPDYYYHESLSALRSGDYASAIELLEKTIMLAPELKEPELLLQRLRLMP
ncbi:MAG TPA: hypothetical protein ENN43_06920 [bacterium]|nr:hypothetical protein [bacterium]